MQWSAAMWAAICPVLFLAVAPKIASAEPFSIEVEGIEHGHFTAEHVYKTFGCHGANVSPRVSWTQLPAGTKSLVVTMFDPDAPTRGLGWTHWEVVNIPASEPDLKKGASANPNLLPAGAVETLTDFGASQYGGPCPPLGTTHRYVITVFALGAEHLDVAPTSSPAYVALQMHGKILAQAKVVATQQRLSN